MFRIKNKSHRKYELARLRAERFRVARRQLSRVEHHNDVILNVEHVASSTSEGTIQCNNDIESYTVTCSSQLDHEPEYEEQYDEPVMVAEPMVGDLELMEQRNRSISVETSDNEQFVNLTISSDSTESEVLSDVIDDFDEVEEIRQWALMNPPIPHARLEQLMSILRRHCYPQLPKTAKTFLGTTSTNYEVENFESDGEFVYLGIRKNLEKCFNCELHEMNEIELLINVDGVPLFKSSKKQLWPILCQVFSIPNRYKPFPVAIYCGNTKPSDLEHYFNKFIDEINELQATGLTVNNHLYNVSIKAFVCDRPARSLLKCMKNHGGYYACERCTIKGVRHKNRIVYPLIGQYEPRTDLSFRNQSNPEHHLGVSPLIRINPQIDLVSQFVMDSMHLLFLGVMKKLLEC